MEKIHYKISVNGKVQGVWFRKYTKEKADELGLKGFVKNESNGSVYIEVEGQMNDLNQLLSWLYQGSPLSKVTSVKHEIDNLKNFLTFKIDR